MTFLRTLNGRLVLALVLLLTLVGTACFFVATWTARGSLDAFNQELHRSLASNLVQEKLIYVDGEINEDGLEGVFHDLMVINPAIECYLLDLEGRVVRYSGAADAVRSPVVDVKPIEEFLAGEKSGPIRGDNPRNLGQRKVFSAAPVMVNDAYEGYLYLILGGQEYESLFQLVAGNYTLAAGLAGSLGILLIALVAGIVLFRVLTRRIRWLSHELRVFESGGFQAPLPLDYVVDRDGGDEIDLLSARFRQMAVRIVEQVEELRSTDTLRRELVANVSHDLRTPLASLKGYLETLLIKEDDLDLSTRRRYVEIAIRHADRLARLVESLFELAKLDARREAPRLEAFALDELVMDILQKFELTAEKKQVRLEAILSDPLPRAHAEIGLIERALENLIDNALWHARKGDQVTVTLGRRGPDLSIRIEDTGPGIPEEQLGKLFDPFFRVEGAKEEDRAGAGLGLAIVKRVLELHERQVRVSSEIGRGTVFTFELGTVS